MRILLYTEEFPPYTGGAGTYVYELALGLHELSNETCVLAPAYGSEDIKIDCEAPFRITRLGPSSLEPKARAVAVKEFLKDNRPDMLLVCDWRSQRCVAAISPSHRPPYCITVHGTEMLRYLGPLRNPSNLELNRLREFFNNGRRVIAISHSTEQLIKKYMPDVESNIAMVHHGINPNVFPKLPPDQIKSERCKLGLDGKRVMLCASRIVDMKGHDVLLAALRVIKHYMDNVVLLIAGEGPHEKEIRYMTTQLGLQNDVIFLGEVPRSYLHRFMNVCDLFVMLSRRGVCESFGLVYIEANSCGKAVLAGRTGGVPEAVENGLTGVLVSPTDVNMVAAATFDLLKDPQQLDRMGERGRVRVLQGFTHKHMAQRTLEVLQNAC